MSYFERELKPLFLEQFKEKPKFEALVRCSTFMPDSMLEFKQRFIGEYVDTDPDTGLVNTSGLGWDIKNMPPDRLIPFGRWMGFPYSPRADYAVWRKALLDWLKLQRVGGLRELEKRMAIFVGATFCKLLKQPNVPVLFPSFDRWTIPRSPDELHTLLPAGVALYGITGKDPTIPIVMIAGNYIVKYNDVSIMKQNLKTHLVKLHKTSSITRPATLIFIIRDNLNEIVTEATVERSTGLDWILLEGHRIDDLQVPSTPTFRVKAPGFTTQQFQVQVNSAGEHNVFIILQVENIRVQVRAQPFNPNRDIGEQLVQFLNPATGQQVNFVLTRDFQPIQLTPGVTYDYVAGQNGFYGSGTLTATEGGEHTITLRWGGTAATIELRNRANGELVPGDITVIGPGNSGIQSHYSSSTGIFNITIEDYRHYTVVVSIEGFEAFRETPGAPFEAGKTHIFNLTESERVTITDPGGDLIDVALIAGRWWTIENFNYSGPNHNGTVGVTYNNDPANGDKWGRLYTMAEVVSIASQMATIAPGYHLPTKEDLYALYQAAGNSRGLKKLTSPSSWPNGNQLETNELKFSALPGGYYQSGFSQGGEAAFFWTSTQSSPYVATVLQITGGDQIEWNESMGVEARCSLRLVKD